MEETSAKIKIECPECEQQFSVPDKYVGKTVECGSCESLFKVTESLFVKERVKFYPGEKKESSLDVFCRSGPVSKVAKVNFTEAHYQADVHAEQVGPAHPKQRLSLAFGIGIMVLMLLIFLLCGGETGAMRDVLTINRFILVGFTSLLGCFLIIYGSVKNRKIGVLLAFILGGTLCAMPFIFPANPIKVSVESSKKIKLIGLEKKSPEQERKDYLHQIGYSPVEKLLKTEPKESVVAIYIPNSSESFVKRITDFLYEKTGRISHGISYTRREFLGKNTNGLIVLKNQTKTIGEIAKLCLSFGNINKIYYDLRVIEVSIDPLKYIPIDSTIPLDQKNSQFETQQLKGLASFDPAVKIATVKRLAISEPKARRDDITKALLWILPDANNELKLATLSALYVWSKKGDGSEKQIFTVVQELHKNKVLLSKETIDFLISRKVEGTEFILMDLWNDQPLEWSGQMMKLFDKTEALLLAELTKITGVHITVASDILAEVGTSRSIPYLQKAIEGHSERGKKELKAAIDAINKRVQKETSPE